MVLKKTPEHPLNSKEIKPVNLKGDQPWIVIGRTEAEAVFWSSDTNRWLIGKVPESGKDWRQREKRASEGEMPGWYHWWSKHELGQTPGGGEGQGGLACCSPWGHKELDQTGKLSNNSNTYTIASLFTFLYKQHICVCVPLQKWLKLAIIKPILSEIMMVLFVLITRCLQQLLTRANP